MKKTVLVFGLISGALMAIFMTGTMIYVRNVGFDRGMILGYAGMVLAFLLVFFGIRSYRENIGGGAISFGRAFAVGILITLISCICYVVAWEILYFKFMPDFADKYAAHAIEKLKAAGATAAAIQAQMDEAKNLKRILDNPFLNAAATFIEPFPVGLIITLISALILRKRKSASSESAVSTAA